MKRSSMIIFALIVGCGGGQRSPTISGDNPDAGVNPDGGNPDAGGNPDGGTVCENTAVPVPLEELSDGSGRWGHIPVSQTPVYVNNPPVNGEHYGESWARWQIYTSEVSRGYWVHNLEHGGVVFLYRPDAPQAVVDGLIAAYNRTAEDGSAECRAAGVHHRRIVVTPDHLLPAALPWAVVASGPENPPGSPGLGVGYMVTGTCVNADFLKAFTESHRGQSAEPNCADPP